MTFCDYSWRQLARIVENGGFMRAGDRERQARRDRSLIQIARSKRADARARAKQQSPPCEFAHENPPESDGKMQVIV